MEHMRHFILEKLQVHFLQSPHREKARLTHREVGSNGGALPEPITYLHSLQKDSNVYLDNDASGVVYHIRK
jgi:hypothetical protein